MKSEYWNSAIGRHPSIAAPTAKPTIVSSAIGVSITRSEPNPSRNPSVTLNAPPLPFPPPAVAADVPAEHGHAIIPFHLFPEPRDPPDLVPGLPIIAHPVS